MRFKYQKFVILFIMIFLVSCSNKKPAETVPLLSEISDNGEGNKAAGEIETEGVNDDSVNHELLPDPNLVQSKFTGLLINKEVAQKRPLAIVINNLKKSLPQSGIGQADIYYEILVEAGITRIVAIFQDFDSLKIGTVRSNRHYFCDFAIDNDAILVHHGSSQMGIDDVKKLGVDDLDGGALDGIAFWRDQDRIKSAGMEHSSYTNAEGLAKAVEKYKYRDQLDAGFTQMFQFYDEPMSPKDAEATNLITAPFSNTQNSIFEYNSSDNLYYRFQNNDKHIDEETGEQLTVSNIIIQLADIYVIKNDTDGHRNAILTGEGTGYLATNGVYVPIKWTRESRNSQTKWFFEDGTPLTLNKGKTWICVYDMNSKKNIVRFE